MSKTATRTSSSLSLFPAIVGFAEGLVRVHVANGVARVFGREGRKVVLLAEEPIAENGVRPGASRREPTTIELANGSEWLVMRGSGCGCGNPLKSFNPRTWQP